MKTDLIDTSKQESLIERDKRKRDRELSDIRFILKTPEGRRFYWRVLAEGEMWKVDFNGDVNQLIFQTGMKNMSAIFMKDLLAAKPEAFIQMQQEYASEQVGEKNLDKIDQKTSN
jgi:hypothetical protein